MIELQNLSMTYSNGGEGLPIICDLDATIEAGESVAIMGQSGTGKSTLLNILGLMIRPTGGGLLIGGENTAHLSDNELAKLRNTEIGMVFQDFHLLPNMTAEENVSLPMMYAGASRKTALMQAQSLLERVGLTDRMDHRPAELSGGQKQRVAVARSLINDPKILLADEPTGALDTTTGLAVLNLLLELSNEQKKTVIMVTHDPQAAAIFSRQVLLTKTEATPVASAKSAFEPILVSV